MKIAIEGMDGVGKTTIAKRLAKKLDFKYIGKPLTMFFKQNKNGEYKEFDKLSRKIMDLDDPVIKAWFFGLGNLYSIRKFENIDLVIDRHFASNYFWNGCEESNRIYRVLIDIIGKPDITILLYASVNERLKRIRNRNDQDYDIFDKEKHVYGYDKMIKFLDTFDINYILIDTENKNIDKVCRECLDEANKLRELL